MSAADVKGMQTVRQILKDSTYTNIRFTVDRWTINPEFYAKVDQALEKGKIGVMVQPNGLPKGVSAQYYPKLTINAQTELYDLIILNSSDLGNTRNQRLHNAGYIVHECTHAGIDMMKWNPMTHLEHETIAYVAHYSAIWKKLKSMGVRPVMKSSSFIEYYAWQAAEAVGRNQVIPSQSIKMLKAAIWFNKQYRKKAFDLANNDGVGREWKLP